MKELLFQPINLLLIAAIGLVYLILILHYTNKKKIASKIETIFVPFLFYFITETWPLVDWHPNKITSLNAKPTSILIRIIFYLAIAVFVLPWLRNLLRNSLLLISDPFLGLLLLEILLSWYWSKVPSITLRSGLVMLGIAVLAANVAQKHSWPELFKIIRTYLLAIAFISIPLAIGMPSVGKDLGGGWSGPVSSSKPLANLMSLCTTLCFMTGTFKPKYPLLWFFLCFMAFNIINLAGAKTGLVVFFVLSALSLMLRTVKSFSFKPALTVTIIMTIIAIVISVIVTENLEYIIVEKLGKSMTLTGRTVIWALLREEIRKRPWFGYGYAGFWHRSLGVEDPAADIQLPGYVPPHAHSGYYEIAVQLGLVGLTLFFLSLIRNFILSVVYMTKEDRNESVMPVILLIYIIASNTTETELLGVISPTYMGFIYIIISCKLTLDTKK
jgi:O-antigen ligase